MSLRDKISMGLVNTREKTNAKAAGRGEISETTIKHASNGFIVSHRHEHDDDGPHYRRPKEHVFKKSGELLTHLRSILGENEPKEDKTGRVV